MNRLAPLALLILLHPYIALAGQLERYYQEQWCNAVGGEMEVVHGHLRVDCETPLVVAEHDFCKKWREGVVQATEYSDETGKSGVLVLICKDNEMYLADRARAFVARYGLPIAVTVMYEGLGQDR